MNLFSNIKGDLYGGINAGVVALPVALAFGSAAGMEPLHGLYGAIFLGLFAAILGGTPTLISNPTGPMAVVTALIVGTQIGEYGSLEAALPSILIIFMLAGLIQVLFGVMKLGEYVSYIPYPVISGFMSGIGMIIIILQIPKFIGAGSAKGTLNILLDIPHMIQSIAPINALLAIATILIIYLLPKLTKKIPSTLVALILVSCIAYFLELDVAVIGNIPSDLPMPKLEIFNNFDMAMITKGIFPALSLAGLGMIDSLLTAVVADNLSKSKHNPNKELIGQGIGNMIAGIFGGIPGAGTTPATVLNINSGGRTRLSGIIHAVILLLILLVGGPVAAKIPIAVLSGILVTVGISVLDKRVVKDIKSMPINDTVIMFAVLIMTVFWDLLFAVGIGLVAASLYFMKKMADVVERETKNSRVDRVVENIIHTFDSSGRFLKKVEIINLNGPLFFGFASRFQNKIDRIKPNISAVVFNFSHVHYIDQSGLYTFEEACKSLHKKKINVCICDLHHRQLDLMKGIELVPNIIDESHVFRNIQEGVQWLNEPGHLENDFYNDNELYIPASFAPNNDGVNDFWILRNIEKHPNCHVMISTRNGVMLFENSGYKEPWSGNNMRNKEVPSGKYIYEVDLHGDKTEVRMGTISIFR